MYADDLLRGAADLKSALHLQDTIISILTQAGFDIRKWMSSNAELVERLPANYWERSDEMTIKSEDYSIKTLGFSWNPIEDYFSSVAELEKWSQWPNGNNCQKSPLFLTNWTGFAFSLNNTIQIICAIALNGLTRLGRCFVEKSSAAVQPTQTSIHGFRKKLHYPENSYQLHHNYLLWNSYVLRRIKNSPRRSCRFTTETKQLRWDKDAENKDQSCPNKELVCTWIRDMRSPSWS